MIFSHRIASVSAVLIAVWWAIPAALGAQAYAIVDSQTGHVLEGKQLTDKRQVGSLTKVATAMVVLDWAERKSGDLTQVASIPPEAFVGTGENRIGFQPGDRVSLRDLLYAALVQSDNIAAYVLAHHVGSQVPAIVPVANEVRSTPVTPFVAQMNALAKQLKMEKTRFVNPHGIDENVKPMPVSTAADMVRLTRYAMNKASFRFYVSQKQRQISLNRGGKQLNYLLRNTNELLGVNNIDGVKTGRTARAGDCLILSSTREPVVLRNGERATVFPRHIIVVLLGSPDRFGEGAQMVARGWQLYDQWVAAGRMVDQKKLL